MKSTCDQVFPIFLQFRQELERYIHQKVGDATIAEDLTGSLALRLYDHCERIPEIQNIRAWLYRLAHNAAMDYHREAKRAQQVQQEMEPADSEDSALFAAAEHCAVRLLDELPETYQLPVRLADLEGVPQKEIAERLQLNYSTLKMRVQRGREKLKALLIDCMEHDRIPDSVACPPGPMGCQDCA